MKKLISILAIFSMLFCSAVSSFSFAENNEKNKSDVVQVNSSDSEKEKTIEKLKLYLTAACMTCLTSVVGFSSYLYGYNKGKNETSIYNMVMSLFSGIGNVFDVIWNGKYGVVAGADAIWNGKYGVVADADTIWNGTKYGVGKAWNGTKYGVGTAWNWTEDKISFAKNWTKNTTAWNWTENMAGSIKNWTTDKLCEKYGVWCTNITDLNDEVNAQNPVGDGQDIIKGVGDVNPEL